jgi:hypothetical protein
MIAEVIRRMVSAKAVLRRRWFLQSSRHPRLGVFVGFGQVLFLLLGAEDPRNL